MNYQTLMSPGKIAGLELKNRIMLAAMGSNFAEEDGTCGERIQAYYEERAKGGAGLLVMETATIAWPAGSTMPRMVGFSEERFLPGLRQLAERVHSHGAKIAAQLNHGGKVAQEDVAAGRPVMVPSIPPKAMSDMFELLTPAELGNFVKAAGPDGKGPRYQVMDQGDIDTVVGQFANAAALAKQAGFDAVEIHAGHGYVLSSFLSPAVNKREDEYGGSRENRARLLCEVIEAVRETVGDDFPIMVRLDAKEFRVEGGIEIDDCLVTVQLAEKAGADAIDVSAYGSTAKGIAFTEAPLVHQPGGFLDFARAVKKVVSIPVISVGRIELDVAEKGLAAGDFDFVAMGRKLLADPYLPNKIAAGRADTIRPCIYCYVCVSKIFINDAMCCAVNPACGREHELNVIHSTAQQQQRALVIGGGPGGLEAGRVLAERGFDVSLWEREKDLGGTARIAALPYEPNARLVKYLSQQVRQLPIDLKLGKTAILDDIEAHQPDVVIVATGANRAAPPIPGKDQRHVFDGNELRGLLFGTDPAAAAKLSLFQRLVVTMGRISQLLRSISALRLLSKLWMPLSKRVVLIGGGLVGLELAEYLEERGREVTVLEPSGNLGAELSIVRRARVVHELREHGVYMHKNANITGITENAVNYEIDGESHSVACDNVIISMGAEPDTSLADSINAAGIRAISVGDCHEVGYIEGAILSGRKAALSVGQQQESTATGVAA